MRRVVTAALLVLISVGSAYAAAAKGYSVTLTIEGVRSSKGHVLTTLCGDPAQFMRGCAGPASRQTAMQGTMKIIFDNVAAGTYAISVLHDENDNGRYDYPDEGYAIGNDAPYPPTFESASIKVSGDTATHVKMVYFTAAQVAPTDIKPIVVRDNGLNAELYVPEHKGKLPAVLVMGGSEGGIGVGRLMGLPLTKEGYAVMALAYFRAEGLPQTLDRIPLEYFKTALDWLKARPEIDASRIAIYGASKGAEAVLVIASHYDGIRAVVAAAPTDVVWQSLNFVGTEPHSSWSLGGKDVPYVPFDTSKPYSPGEPYVEIYRRSIKADPNHDDAIIKVENIKGAVLLLSGTDDQEWDSTEMADRVIARLDAHHFAYPHQHLRYEGAGHLCCINPGAVAAGVLPPTLKVGGTPEIDAKARADAWHEIVAFLDSNLKH